MVLCKYYVISSKRQEHLRTPLSAGVLEPALHGLQGTAVSTQTQKQRSDTVTGMTETARRRVRSQPRQH